MRTLFVIIVAALLSGVPSALAEDPPAAPARVNSVGTIAGTIVLWTPSSDVHVSYVVYRGMGIDNLTEVARTPLLQYYDTDVRPQAGQTVFYGIAAILNGVESPPTILDASPRSSCVTVGTNGHVNMRPYNCLD